jgi:hypothetical protein
MLPGIASETRAFPTKSGSDELVLDTSVLTLGQRYRACVDIDGEEGPLKFISLFDIYMTPIPEDPAGSVRTVFAGPITISDLDGAERYFAWLGEDCDQLPATNIARIAGNGSVQLLAGNVEDGIYDFAWTWTDRTASFRSVLQAFASP